MDVLLPYGVFLFGVTGGVVAICAMLSSLAGLGATGEMWNMALFCGAMFLVTAFAMVCHDTLERRKAARKRRR